MSFVALTLILVLLLNIFPHSITSFIYQVEGAGANGGLEEQYRVVKDTLFKITTDVIDLSNSTSMLDAEYNGMLPSRSSCMWLVIYYDSTCGHCRLLRPYINIFAAWVTGVQNSAPDHVIEGTEEISMCASPPRTSNTDIQSSSTSSYQVLKCIVANHANRRGWLGDKPQQQNARNFFSCLFSPLIITAVNCAQFDGDCRSNAVRDVPTLAIKYRNKDGILTMEVLQSPEEEVTGNASGTKKENIQKPSGKVADIYGWVGDILDLLHRTYGNRCSHMTGGDIGALSHDIGGQRPLEGSNTNVIYDNSGRHRCASTREYLISQKQARIVYQRHRVSDNMSTSNPALSRNDTAKKYATMSNDELSRKYKLLLHDVSEYHRQDVAGALFFTLWYEVPMNGIMSSVPIETSTNFSDPEMFITQSMRTYKKEVLLEFLKVVTDTIPWLQTSSLIGFLESGVHTVRQWRQRLLAAHIPFRLVRWYDNTRDWQQPLLMSNGSLRNHRHTSDSADHNVGRANDAIDHDIMRNNNDDDELKATMPLVARRATVPSSVSSFAASDIEWRSCRGSSSQYRGFTCGLWMLYHAMVTSSSDPDKALVAVKNYVSNFFLCKECRHNFRKFKWIIPSGYKRNFATHPALQLWWVHNNVNKRLSKDTVTNDPVVPKRVYPSKAQCPRCYNDIHNIQSGASNENIRVGNKQPIGVDGEIMSNSKYNINQISLDAFPELHHFNLEEVLLFLQSVYRDGNAYDNNDAMYGAKQNVASRKSEHLASEVLFSGLYDKMTSQDKESDTVLHENGNNIVILEANHSNEESVQHHQNVSPHECPSGLEASVMFMSFCVTVGIFGLGFVFGTLRRSPGGVRGHSKLRKGTYI